MKLIFYELRKNFLRKHVLVLLIVLSILDVMKIATDWYQGNIDTVVMESEENHRAYTELYDSMKGNITSEKLQFLMQEEARLGNIFDKNLNYNDPDELTYSGNLYEDYRILEVYIAHDFYYMKDYKEYSEQITALAEENIAYYTEKNNELKARENKYIAETYSNRRISQFYRTDCIQSYLKNYFSVVLMLFMSLLIVAPSFSGEYECHMSDILATSRKGHEKSTWVKIVASVCCSCLIVIWFSLLDLLTYEVICGFEGLENPIWALESFQESFLNCSILDFIIYEIELRLLGITAITMVILLLSAALKKIVYVTLGFGVLCGGWYAASTYIFYLDKVQMLFGLWNPITLLCNVELYQGFCCIEWKQYFMMESTMCILGNILLIFIMFILVFVIKRRTDKCR